MALHFLLEDAPDARSGDTVTLIGAEAHHAATVRRVRIGEDVTIGDGRGMWLTCVVSSVQPKAVEVTVMARRDELAAAPRILLVQALAKGDRDELAIQAATELGVDEIVPWQAERSVSRWDAAKAAKGRARWETIVREASKQAHRAWLPTVASIASTADVAALARAGATVLVLEPTGDSALTAAELPADADVILVVGPEGGISGKELEAFEDAGARIVRLGSTVLRTSTAGPAAVSVVSARLGRW
ncbi:16S rRNA (uracil(1498)-N(3))-methyltransferase [Microbacterium candidum]|uniref:Ribosomal RNA small subunit methyltransferase E n=1 Tax=Microbacterium candidum TaxID=3041922 RepID=A0ABT7MYX4_9MICO|nr:16S rRNA (uracil(1498)-N(3))-methyltransferase [Microbacterium sp. ASV49]MDL9979649.1 16S rRNA (uracil(1498)-N(3))-methyltransferase [Microbacterium sp. ASV49]